jgi:hypothetical protein
VDMDKFIKDLTCFEKVYEDWDQHQKMYANLFLFLSLLFILHFAFFCVFGFFFFRSAFSSLTLCTLPYSFSYHPLLNTTTKTSVCCFCRLFLRKKKKTNVSACYKSVD